MTYKEQYLNRLILYSYTIKHLGLLYGRLGHILALFELSKDSKYCAQLVYYANRELERIISSVSKNTSVEFADGLCGIGWGIEYLIYNGFVEGNSIEICEEIDAQLMSANLKSFDNSLENGIKGVLHYVLAHLANCCLQNKGMPFRHEFISSLKELCDTILFSENDSDLTCLAKMFIDYADNKVNNVYSYNILQFVNNKDNITYDTLSLALRDGISGLLIKTQNESYNIVTRI